MKVKQLKLYNKYKDIGDTPNKEFIYVGVDNENDYCFLFKNKDNHGDIDIDTAISTLNHYGLDPDKIVNDLNLETFIKYDNDLYKYIKGYDILFCKKEYIENYLKPILKDKLNNIINR
jgi:hypothetical protein